MLFQDKIYPPLTVVARAVTIVLDSLVSRALFSPSCCATLAKTYASRPSGTFVLLCIGLLAQASNLKTLELRIERNFSSCGAELLNGGQFIKRLQQVDKLVFNFVHGCLPLELVSTLVAAADSLTLPKIKDVATKPVLAVVDSCELSHLCIKSTTLRIIDLDGALLIRQTEDEPAEYQHVSVAFDGPTLSRIVRGAFQILDRPFERLSPGSLASLRAVTLNMADALPASYLMQLSIAAPLLQRVRVAQPGRLPPPSPHQALHLDFLAIFIDLFGIIPASVEMLEIDSASLDVAGTLALAASLDSEYCPEVVVSLRAKALCRIHIVAPKLRYALDDSPWYEEDRSLNLLELCEMLSIRLTCQA